VEYVRFVRDSNCLAVGGGCGATWLNSLSSCTGANGCTIDPSTAAVAACSSGGCGPLRKHDDGVAGDPKYFTYVDDSGTTNYNKVTPQGFVRTITFTAPATGETTEEVLSVAVSWRAQSGVTRTITVRENLFDWQ
jgi:hypothetical protein